MRRHEVKKNFACFFTSSSKGRRMNLEINFSLNLFLAEMGLKKFCCSRLI